MHNTGTAVARVKAVSPCAARMQLKTFNIHDAFIDLPIAGAPPAPNSGIRRRESRAPPLISSEHIAPQVEVLKSETKD